MKPESLKETQHGGNHYKIMEIEPVEYIYKNKLEFLEGSVIKHVSRHEYKGKAEDIKKAIHYLQILLEMKYCIKSVMTYANKEKDI